MEYNKPVLKEKIIKQISELAEKYMIKKVILFGSRARGDNKIWQ